MIKKDYHKDEALRIPNERYAGIVVKDGRLLLIHRIKKGFEYYVFPGGHRRQDEKPEEVVLREVEEETAIIAVKPRLVITNYDEQTKQTDYYYLCRWRKGEEPKLNGEEKVKNCQENFFEPMWIELEKAKKLNILPVFAKDWFVNNLGKI